MTTRPETLISGSFRFDGMIERATTWLLSRLPIVRRVKRRQPTGISPARDPVYHNQYYGDLPLEEYLALYGGA